MTLEQALSEGHVVIPPDLAVEVVSPNDYADNIDTKIEELQEAGVPLIWVVHPANRTVAVHRKDAKGSILRDTDDLDGEAVLPGFTCRVAELFQPPPGVAADRA